MSPRASCNLADLAAVSDDDRRAGLAARRADGLDRLNDVHALGDLAEHHVLAVQPGGDHGAQEELHSDNMVERQSMQGNRRETEITACQNEG